MKAIWNGQVLAESPHTIVIDGNHYFPPETLNMTYFEASDTHTSCPWKGRAWYYSLQVNGKALEDAAWYYPEPYPVAAHFKSYVAFWKGVDVMP